MGHNEIILSPNSIYHIYNHANGNENFFQNQANYIYFLKRYQFFIEPIANTFAYCLMPNHLHLMVQFKNETELQKAHANFKIAKNVEPQLIKEIAIANLPAFISKTFGNLFSSYTQAFNRQQNRKGNLFTTSFKRKLIDSEQYYTKLIHYIHNNPVHHGFVTLMEDWAFSSYNAYTANKKTKIAIEDVLKWFGNKEAFMRFHQQEKMDLMFDF
jgi:putative transposase